MSSVCQAVQVWALTLRTVLGASSSKGFVPVMVASEAFEVSF